MNTTFDAYFTALKGKNILVMGLGVSNRPLVRLLLEYGCTVTACDKTPYEKLDGEILELEKLGCRLKTGPDYLQDLNADVVFRTPGMHPNIPALQALRQQGAVVTSEMEAFFRVCPCKILAVTGSDGKTTTTTLISEMLKKAGYRVWLGGNIGTPLLPLVRQMAQTDMAVVELSSFQLMDMQGRPNVAVVTNVTPNHLDVHKDMEEYVTAKTRIFAFQLPEDVLILNADNAVTDGFSGKARIKKFSRQGSADLQILDGWICRGQEKILNTEDIRLPGVHNIENYMAAILAVEGLVGKEDIVHVAKTFGGVAHRCELVREKDEVRYYNDSIASSPTRTAAGLRSFQQKVILIAGGYDKKIPYDALGPEICAHVKALFLCGDTGPKIRQAVEAAAEYRAEALYIRDCADLEEAVKQASSLAQKGDVVIMSPASASFDRFKNFEHRGDFFKQLIKEL